MYLLHNHKLQQNSTTDEKSKCIFDILWICGIAISNVWFVDVWTSLMIVKKYNGFASLTATFATQLGKKGDDGLYDESALHFLM